MPIRQCLAAGGPPAAMMRCLRPLFPACLAVLAAAGCSNQVAIPPAAQDHPPTVTVTGTPSGGGDIETQNATATSTVNVDTGTNLLMTGAASNPGGVKSFAMTIGQGGQTLFQAATSSTPDASGLVPNRLSIL